MPSSQESDARLNLPLSAELKDTIERAAAITGQTLSDFAISVLKRDARRVIEEHEITVLTKRNLDAFLAHLDQPGARPNKALSAAARRSKKQLG